MPSSGHSATQDSTSHQSGSRRVVKEPFSPARGAWPDSPGSTPAASERWVRQAEALAGGSSVYVLAGSLRGSRGTRPSR